MDPLLPDDPPRVGGFELLGRLGSGGMGQVYLGRAPDGSPAAVKLVHEAHAGDPRFRVRFAREVSTARRVRATWAAAVLDADPDAARPWLATRYVLGPSLEQQVTSGGVLSGGPLYVLAGRLAAALAELHAMEVVHRDLKPSNVLLAADGPKLIDFGIARALGASKITDTGEVIGTPGYMSPEQASGEDGGPASDVFSLASVLVFAASGQGPFGLTASPVAMLLRVVQGAPDLAELPDDLRRALEPCLAKNPAARPTAARLAEALAAKANRPTHWPPPPAGATELPEFAPPTPTLAEPPAAASRTAAVALAPTLVTSHPTLVATPGGWPVSTPLPPAAPGWSPPPPGAFPGWSPPRSPPPGPVAPVRRTRRRAAFGTAVVLVALLAAGVGLGHQATPPPPNATPTQPPQTQPPPQPELPPQTQPPHPAQPPTLNQPPAELTPLRVTREPKADAHTDVTSLAVTRDGGRLLVTSGGRLEVLDPASYAVLDGLAVAGATHVVATPDGLRAFVATADGSGSAGRIAAVNMFTKQTEYTVATVGPVDEMTISSDGSRVVAVSGSRDGGSLGATVLATATWSGRLPPPLPPGRDATVALSPDGRRAYFAYRPPEQPAAPGAAGSPATPRPAPAQPPVLAVDLDTGARTEIQVPAEGFAALRGVRRLAVSPDGRRLYAATAATVSVLDTGTNAVLGTAPAGVGVTGLAVSPSGRYLFASSSADRAVHVYDVTGGGPPHEVGRAADVGGGSVGGGAPEHLSMAPDGGHLYLSSPTGLSTVDTAGFR